MATLMQKDVLLEGVFQALGYVLSLIHILHMLIIFHIVAAVGLVAQLPLSMATVSIL